MAFIPGGGGARNKDEEEISGGGVGREEERPEMFLPPKTRRGYRSPLVRRPKLVILSSARGTQLGAYFFYGFGMFMVTDQRAKPNRKP
jgi:hypothetical protein